VGYQGERAHPPIQRPQLLRQLFNWVFEGRVMGLSEGVG